MRVEYLTISLILASLTGCDWVDSTGRSENGVPTAQISFDDGSLADTLVLREETSLVLKASSVDVDGVVSSFSWSEEPVEQGNIGQCAGLDGFDVELAADTLQDACTEQQACRVSIEQQGSPQGGEVSFLIVAPKLRAPVGVTYRLSATDNEGSSGVQESTFCLQSFNEPPVAEDDTFTLLEGDVFEVFGGDALNILTNDRDDEDIRNAGLSVELTPVRSPEFADFFELRADGGFSYAHSGGNLQANTTDSFEYQISDGENSSAATVNLIIVARDDPPTVADNFPKLFIIAGIPYETSLASVFTDPEGSDLSFSVGSGSLPPSGQISLTANGVLSGTAESVDVGEYSLTISASDGNNAVPLDIAVEVLENLPLESTPIPSQAVLEGEAFELNVAPFFTDPEAQQLMYRVLDEDPAAMLSINPNTGLLSGFFSAAGAIGVTVLADDGFNAPTRIRFTTVVNSTNLAPTVGGNLSNQSLTIGQSIAPIRGNFNDADGDQLTITLTGNAPAGISVGADGVLRGTPTEEGVYSGLRLRATDPDGASVSTNAFSITVTPILPPPNAAPVFVAGTVFNQGIPLGGLITPVRPQFTDSNGDTLTYSVIGNTLPLGVTINRNTGVVSGSPATAVWVRNLRIQATDPGGLTAISTTFWIRVL